MRTIAVLALTTTIASAQPWSLHDLYETPILIPVPGPYTLEWVHALDLDNDSDTDIACISPYGPVTILRNDGGLDFTSIETGFDGYWIDPIFTDLDNDNDPDLIGTTYSGTLITLINNGDMTFASPVAHVLPEFRINEVRVSDLNDDGLPDLVLATKATTHFTTPSDITVYLATPEGTYERTDSLPALPTVRSLFVADLNNDNQPEIIAATNTTSLGLYVFSVDTLGHLTHISTHETQSNADIVDVRFLNNDSHPSVITEENWNIIARRANPNGSIGSPANLTQQILNLESIVFADLNDDSEPDLLVGSSQNTASVYLKSGTYTHTYDSSYSTGTGAMIAAEDLDNDGRPELIGVAFPSSISIVPSSPTGWRTGFASELDYREEFAQFVTGDINNDGAIDTVAVHGPSNTEMVIESFLNDGTGSLRHNQLLTIGSFQNFKDPVLADIDNDSDLDLIIADTEHDSVNIKLNLGDPFFIDPFGHGYDLPSVGTTPRSPQVHDLNNDTHPDIINVNQSDDTLTINYNLGTEPYFGTDTTTLPTGDEPIALRVTDLDLNGTSDFVVLNQGSNDITVYLNDPIETDFVPLLPIPVGSNPDSLIVEDLNNDTYPDIACLNLTSASISVILSDTQAGFQPPITLDAPDFATHLRSADIDNDSDPDLIVVSSPFESFATFFRNDGSATFTQQDRIELGRLATDLRFADFNNDNTPDLATTSLYTHTIAVHPNRTPFLNCPQDLNEDTQADFFDLSLLLTSHHDYTGDSIFDFFDISAFLQDLAAGCP